MIEPGSTLWYLALLLAGLVVGLVIAMWQKAREK